MLRYEQRTQPWNATHAQLVSLLPPPVPDGVLELLARLLADEARARASASEALLIGAFAPHRLPPPAEKRECPLCGDDVSVADGVCCRNGHFHCRADLRGLVR